MTDRSSQKRTPPSWGADLRRSALGAAGLAISYTLLLLLASTGLMRHETTGTPILADAAWAGILVGVGGVGWAFLQISTTRDDTGYRHDRLPSLLLLAVLCSTAIHVALMTAWPLIIGDRAAPDDVIATLTSNPLSLAIVATFILAIQSFGATIVLALIRIRVPGVLVAVVSLLVLLGVGAWQGVTILGSPSTMAALAVWVSLAVVGLGAMALTAVHLGPARAHR